MGEVRLTGQLVCRDEGEAALVHDLLPEHLRLTHAEPGCVSFEVTATADSLVWEVAERFVDPAAFAAHQKRTKSSAWGVATAGIERRFTVEGL